MTKVLEQTPGATPVRSAWDAAQERYWAVLRQNGLLAAKSLAFPPSPGADSALFHRLQGGQPALKFPPPTTHGYPWYALIEEPGTHLVQKVRMADKQPPGAVSRITINHCEWRVLEANAAATQLFALERALQGTLSVLPPKLREEVMSAYAAGPEVTVQYGRWSPFNLGLTDGPARVLWRHYAEAALQGQVSRKPFSSLLALDCLYVNGVLSELPDGAGDDLVVFRSAHWCLQATVPMKDCYVRG